ncbi:sensor histidine kinase [Enterocloster sp. OA13]|uniref:sensor histidine kinase n=1 Tax=Enterocloster sp. OA13 TaxID=2914161 RepID=UPI001F057321|nr:sensor histidine kinase [Enterocloster sp. OA13]
MTSKNKVSYIKRHFLILFLLVVILVGIMGTAIIRFSKGVVGNEIIKLHQAILKQSANGTADTLGSLKESLSNIAQNARVTQWLAQEEKTAYAEAGWTQDTGDSMDGYVDGLVQDEIYKNYKRGNIFRIYIYDLQGLRYSSDRPVVTWETAVDYIKKAAPVGEDMPDYVLLDGPVRSDEGGLYRHGFYLIEPVKDLLSEQVEGYVLMHFSEKVLYDSYSDMRGKDRKFCIVSNSGTLVSGENKSEIGGWPAVGEPMMGPGQESKQALDHGLYQMDHGLYQTTGQGPDLEPGKLPAGGLALDSGTSGFIPVAGYRTVADQGQDYMYFYENILGTDWYLMERINVHEIWATLDRTGYFSLLLIAAFVLCLYPLTIFSRKRIIKPVDKIKDKMSQVAEGRFDVRISSQERGKGEFAEIADSFNYMVDRLEKQVEEIRAMDRKKHLLELDFLQAQINPHFIYNTLSSIRFYVEMGKNEEAEDMLIDFSKILRKTLSRTEQFITLREEMETLRHYVNLQKARYRERVEVVFDVEESTLPALVPDFILQPIVENAIFYSLKEDKVCHIRIKSYMDQGNLCVSVKDDGVGMDAEKISTVLNKDMNINKVGIKNVNERLKLNFGDVYGLKIISEEGRGTEVILVMPSTTERKRLR